MYFRCLQNPKFVLLILLLVTVGIGSQLGDIQMDMDLATQSDDNIPAVKEFLEIEDTFGNRDEVTLHLQFTQTLTLADHCRLHALFTDFKNQWSHIDYVNSPWTVRGVVSQPGFLAFPPLHSDPCAKSAPAFQNSIQPLFNHNWVGLKPQKVTVSIGISRLKNKSALQSFVPHIDTLISDIENLFPQAQVLISGPSSFRYYLLKTAIADSWVSLVATLVLMFLLALFFAQPKVAVLFIITTAIAFILTFGTISLMGVPLSFLINGLVLILLISMISDFVFVLSRGCEVPIDQAFQELLIPSFYTSLTTVLGFLSLLLSDFSIIREFGVAAAIGAVFEWLSCFFLLPALIKTFPFLQLKVKKSQLVDSWITKISNWRIPGFVAKSLLLVALAGIPSMFFLNFHDEPVKNFPKGHPLRKAIQELHKANQPETAILIKVPKAITKSTRQILKSQLSNTPDIYSVHNFEGLLSENIETLSEERKSLVLRELKTLSAYRSFVSPDEDEKWVVFIKNYSTNSIRSIISTIRTICSDCSVGGHASTFAEVSQKVSGSLISSFAVSLILVCLVVLFLIRRQSRNIQIGAFISILLGPLALLTLIASLQISVNIVTSIFFAVIVALTGDNFIQYFQTENENLEEGLLQKGKASVFISGCLTLVSGVFVMQTLIPLKVLGGLFVIGFIINFLGDFFVLKYLLKPRE